MYYYFAPMEGITGHLFRNAHHRYFPGVDRYFLPFFSPGLEHSFTQKSFRDLMPERNAGIPAVPQLLTRRAEDFIWAAEELAQLGYDEVNLNLGCPSGTVTAKGKGAGFLAFPDQLNLFLEEIFAGCPLNISVKTRLGLRDPAEFGPLLDIFNQYPISELIIHPRVRTDFYKNAVNRGAFETALSASRNPVCYNGDLVTADSCIAFAAQHPGVPAVMLGRGLVGDPALVTKLTGGPGADRGTLRLFHDELYEGYCTEFGSRRNATLRMKEVWFYLIHLFADSEPYAKQLKKATTPTDYQTQVDGIFCNLTLLPDSAGGW